jgi:hypothetical protein
VVAATCTVMHPTTVMQAPTAARTQAATTVAIRKRMEQEQKGCTTLPPQQAGIQVCTAGMHCTILLKQGVVTFMVEMRCTMKLLGPKRQRTTLLEELDTLTRNRTNSWWSAHALGTYRSVLFYRSLPLALSILLLRVGSLVTSSSVFLLRVFSLLSSCVVRDPINT